MQSLILTWKNIDKQSVEKYIPFWRLKLKSNEYEELKKRIKNSN